MSVVPFPLTFCYMKKFTKMDEVTLLEMAINYEKSIPTDPDWDADDIIPYSEEDIIDAYVAGFHKANLIRIDEVTLLEMATNYEKSIPTDPDWDADDIIPYSPELVIDAYIVGFHKAVSK